MFGIDSGAAFGIVVVLVLFAGVVLGCVIEEARNRG